MPAALVTDHVHAGLSLLLQQYKELPRMEGWATSYLNRVQELEDAIWSVIVGRLIDDAIGVQLDALGRLVGQRRDGVADEPFRMRIRARIRANRSNGHPDDIIAVALLASGVSLDQLTYTDLYPASFRVELFSVTDATLAPVLTELITLAKPVGVGAAVAFSAYPDSETFAFALGDTPTADATRGWASTDDPTVAPGGRWIDSV